jgi:hypothetical protein
MNDQNETNWNTIISSLAVGYLGYVAGTNKYSSWEPIINNFKDRLSHLAYFRALRPLIFINETSNSLQLLNEAILAYLFGLPNASVPLSIRCLEIGIKAKYEKHTQKKAPEKLFDLIEWSEIYLNNKKEIAHGFRILRNTIHGTALVTEQVALETIINVVQILNHLYVLDALTIHTITLCKNCGAIIEANIPIHDNYLGRVLTFNCNSCMNPTSVIILGYVS